MIFGRLRCVALCAALVGCEGGERASAPKPDPQAAASPPAKTEPAKAEPEQTEPEQAAPEQAAPAQPEPSHCRDWSSLDVSSLPPLPATPYTQMFAQVWKRVLEKHYDPTIGCLDWPALRQEFGARLTDAKDVAAAVDLVTEMLGRLQQSHFSVRAPGERREDALAGPGRAPIAVRLVEDRPVVVQGNDSIPAGAVVVSIGGTALEGVIAGIRRGHRRPAEVAFRARRDIDRRLSCQPGTRVRVVVERPGGGQIDRPLPCELPPGELVTFGNLRDVPARVQHRMVPGTKVGYLTFNVWLLPLVERVRAALADLRRRGMRALVLDLRGNPGGVGPMSVPVARMLLAGGGSLGKMQFREFTQEFAVAADPDPFAGPVAVLIDEGTASTSEIFAAGMRDLGRIRVFGAGPSAGAALPSIIEELDGGVILQYVVGDYHSPKGTVVEGRGVVPDVLIEETRADFVAGRDSVLDAAVEALGDSIR